MDYDMSQQEALVERGESFDRALPCASYLKESPLFQQLLRDVDMDSWSFEASTDGNNSYDIDLDEGVVMLPVRAKQTSSQHVVLLNTVRALRDVWYEDHHFDLCETLRPDEILKWERIRSADIETFTIAVAWELRIAGNQDVWRALMGTDSGDMAMIFQAIMETQNGTDARSIAMLHAFRQWSMGENRINDTDSITLSSIDEFILDREEQVPFGEGRLSPKDLEARLSYLKGTQNMLASPEFCALPSDINETHLFHIMNDIETVQVQGIRFRDKDLAVKLFPTG